MPEESWPFVSWRMLGGGPEFDFNGVRLSPWMWEPGRAPWVKRAEEEASRSAAQVVQAEPESEPSGSTTTESGGAGAEASSASG